MESDENMKKLDKADIKTSLVFYEYMVTYNLHELLYEAVNQGYISCIKLLLENNARLYGHFVHNVRLYILAAKQESTREEIFREEIFKLLDDAHCFGIHHEDCEYRQTPLAHAIESNDLISVEKLLLLGISPLQARIWPNMEGAFAYAIISNKITLMKLLLASGAHPDDEDYDDADRPTALVLASESNNEDMIKLLLGVRSSVNCSLKRLQPIYAAVRSCSLNIIRGLINRGARINHADEARQTALGEAVSSRDISIIELLLAYGAEVTFGVSVRAKSRGCSRIATLLLEDFVEEEEASLKFTLGPNNQLVWSDMMSRRRRETIEMLLEAGADQRVFEEISNRGYTIESSSGYTTESNSGYTTESC
ncbi:hypothetical protein I7I50_02022 [Histoplasma capsulatum G186AR]|uniref:Ankyrin repeat protein n=1 Tax=Ajellomyces capsulatus TaxID=5037 RepID=A0A8H8CTZ0_AJECA|nr:hypothetical protein I7I52_12236 [Histoplasma capsulatum]QSS71253.1 hypothetical protein I7I50_02022 [Histoplasma capsulatum G186AR]